MSVITFWNSGKEQTGKTMTAVAIASYMAITHNKKILLISTGYNDTKINKCFWNEKKIQKSLGIFGPNTNTGVEEGIEGAMRIMQSNKLSPQIITNYTKIVYKERLEVLTSFKGTNSEYQKLKKAIQN